MSRISHFLCLVSLFLLPTAVLCQISASTFSKFPDVLSLGNSFDPIIEAYWTGLPHHRRTPFAVSPDGKSAYLAYLASSKDKVFVQQVDPSTFKAVGTPAQIDKAREAGGLVARNDGFAVLVNIDNPSTTHPIATIVRYKGGSKAWTRPVNGPEVHDSDGNTSSPDMNGDLVYSEAAGLYAAYFVVTAYSGSASGHFGDAIKYVDDSGALKQISGASSQFGCSHNTGISIEASDAPPFASVCAEDHGSIWLNTKTQYMSGIKIANENTTNGVSGEPMGGMGGSYSNLALFPGTTSHIFAWQSRGAVRLTQDDWMGQGYTQCSPRWLNHNVAISILKDKNTLVGPEAISKVGAPSGDDQVTWITKSDNTDHQNVRVEALDSANAVVTWEELSSPNCQPVPLSCSGRYTGTFFQQVNAKGEKVGDAFSVTDAFVSGDMVRIPGKGICWPYVKMVWDLSQPKSSGTPVSSMSFACVALSGGSSPPPSSSAPGNPTSTRAGTSPVTTPAGSPTGIPSSTINPSPTPTGGPEPEPTNPGGNPEPSDIPENTATNGATENPNTAKQPTPTSTGYPKSGGGMKWCSQDSDCAQGETCRKFKWGMSICVPPS